MDKEPKEKGPRKITVALKKGVDLAECRKRWREAPCPELMALAEPVFHPMLEEQPK